MNGPARMSLGHGLQFALVVILAAALRFGYLHVATHDGFQAPRLMVQGPGRIVQAPADDEPQDRAADTELGVLRRQLHDTGAFETLAPLADKVEPTAHVAPGYYWLVAQLAALDSEPDAIVRWLQCVLGVLTVGLVYLFARRAFGSGAVAFLAGLLAALHPFWILNAAELSDGVVVTFLLTLALVLGTRGNQEGGAFTSVLFGLSLAGLAMVRAALLPFAVLGLLWFLFQCRHVRFGWFNAILAFLGFANGLAPWAVRNWRLYEEPTPVVTSAYLHLWIGNNRQSDGGPLDETWLRRSLQPDRLQALLDEPNQARRYDALGQDVWREVMCDPAAAVSRRWQAGMKFLTGAQWFRAQRMSRVAGPEPLVEHPVEWLPAHIETWLQASLLILLVLAALGWRFSSAWKRTARLGSIALVTIPLPFVLSHAEDLSGPRLPWDALLICYSAYALACLLPSVARGVEEPEGPPQT